MFARIEQEVLATHESDDVFVPVNDFPLYLSLVGEIAQTVASNAGGNDLLLIVDADTAHDVKAVEEARGTAKRAFHFGDTIPQAWAVARNVTPCNIGNGISSSDRFLIALSANVSFAVLGAVSNGKKTAQLDFTGAWTGGRHTVEEVARKILDLGGCGEEDLLRKRGTQDSDDVAFRSSLRMMAHMMRTVSSRQRDMAQDKDDLFSVLGILKAISAQRRAHDILYVFVDQIARIVKMDRCSVVRVWGGEDKGHVLASHEDASIRDLVIDLTKYPELHYAMEHREKVVINDVFSHELTQPFEKQLRQSGITSLIVIPVVLFDQNVGSFFLRAARGSGPFASREVSFCEIVAEAAANALERAHLFESIQRANERLEFLAVTDGLTGLYNHRFFRERLDEEFERARRYKLPLSCLILDVDDFKNINDTFGHLEGDTVLREIAVRTSQMVRKSDVVARYGGEEFVVIMPQTGKDGARVEAERIRKEISGRPYDSLPQDTRITVSVGVAVFDYEKMLDCEALIRTADGALYEAKRSGKNRVIIGESE